MAGVTTPREEREAILGCSAKARFELTGDVVYRGLFSTVFLAKDKSNDTKACVKVLLKRNFDSEEERRNAAGELALHSGLPPHRNVVRPLLAEETLEAMILVTRYTPHGDLWELTRYSQTYCEVEVRNCVSQMLAGLRHIHGAMWGGVKTGIIHCDIKPHNFLLFLVDGRFVVQLCDFGLAERPTHEGKIAFRGIRGTSGWFAPEVLASKDYDMALDLFGVGLIAFRMIGGYPAFDPPSRVTEKVDFDEQCFCHISDPGRDTVEKLLSKDPAVRGTSEAACECEWISGPGPPEPTPEMLKTLSMVGPPPRTDVLFWHANDCPDINEP